MSPSEVLTSGVLFVYLKEANNISSGLRRKIDPTGRIVMPIDFREQLNLNIGDEVEINILGNEILVKAYRPGCYMCGSQNELRPYRGFQICPNCRHDIGAL